MGKESHTVDEILSAFSIRLSYGMTGGLHSHSTTHEFYFAVEDGGYQQWGEGACEMSAGDLYFFPSGMPHNGSGPETGTCRGLVIQFSYDMFSPKSPGDSDMRQVIAAMGDAAQKGNPMVPTSGSVDDVQRLMEDIIGEMQHKGFGYVSKMKALLMELLCDVLRSGKLNFKKPVAKPVSNEERIWEVCRFLKRNHELPSSVDDMARMANMSRSYFHAQFKEVTGMPYKEYLNDLRAKTALNLLETTDLTLEQVATLAGFGSVSNFYLVFRKHVGTPPRQIRRASAVADGA